MELLNTEPAKQSNTDITREINSKTNTRNSWQTTYYSKYPVNNYNRQCKFQTLTFRF